MPVLPVPSDAARDHLVEVVTDGLQRPDQPVALRARLFFDLLADLSHRLVDEAAGLGCGLRGELVGLALGDVGDVPALVDGQSTRPPGCVPSRPGPAARSPGSHGQDGRVEYVEIARAESPRGELVLRERRPDDGPTSLELRANGIFVMDTVESSTERALASEALAVVDDPRAVVVAGLGLGFTMHEVLADSRVERCSVVEVEEALVGWMRDGTVPHGPALLADERVTVVVADIAVALAEARPATYDLILLDVDNGPGYLVHEGNAALYSAPSLATARRVLRPGGALVVWSAVESSELEQALAAEFDAVDGRPHEVRLQGREEHYWLYAARLTTQENSAR